jgi:hypothetical protein
MKTKTLFIKLILPAALIFCLAFTGCGQKKQTPNPKAQSLGAEQKGDKIPEQLTGIESNIEKIFTALKGPAAEVQSGKENKEGQGGQDTGGNQGGQKGGDKEQGGGEKQSGSEGDKKKSGEEGSDKEGGSQGGGQGGGQKGSSGADKQQDKQQGQAAGQQKQDPWTDITTTVNNLHYQWNSYMPMAAQKGANKALMDNFSKALNSLTNTIIVKNSTNTLMAANFLYAYIPDFYSIYKTESSPEIKRIKYHIRNEMLNSWTANWEQADSDMNALKSSWPIVKNTISKDQQDNTNKLDYSLYELEKVIKDKNQPLIDIKGRVALSNITAIEQGMQKSQGGSSSGSQSGGGESGGAESGGGSSGGGGQSGGGSSGGGQ